MEMMLVLTYRDRPTPPAWPARGAIRRACMMVRDLTDAVPIRLDGRRLNQRGACGVA